MTARILNSSAPPNFSPYGEPSLWQLGRLGDQSLDLKNELGAQAGLSSLVVGSPVVQFALGQRIERNSHALQAGSCVTEHCLRWTRGQGTRFHSLISTRGLFDPEAVDLFSGEGLQTYEESPGKVCPILRIKAQCRRFDILDAHDVEIHLNRLGPAFFFLCSDTKRADGAKSRGRRPKHRSFTERGRAVP